MSTHDFFLLAALMFIAPHFSRREAIGAAVIYFAISIASSPAVGWLK
jgi:hypothetical protein